MPSTKTVNPRCGARGTPAKYEQEFCKMQSRIVLGRKDLLRDLSSRERKCLLYKELIAFFKEIKPTISLKNIGVISIFQKFSTKQHGSDRASVIRVPDEL